MNEITNEVNKDRKTKNKQIKKQGLTPGALQHEEVCEKKGKGE